MGAVVPAFCAACVDCVGTDAVAGAVDPADTGAAAGIGGSADLEACAVTVPLLVTAAAAIWTRAAGDEDFYSSNERERTTPPVLGISCLDSTRR